MWYDSASKKMLTWSENRVTYNLMNTADASVNKPVYLVPAVDRAFRIVELLKAKKCDMSLAEITKATGWHKSSIHKLLVTLSHHGILERDEDTKRYSLGIKLAEYGRIALNKLDIRHS